MIKAIIFDFDDTLVNTWPWHRQAIDIALKPHGTRIADIDQVDWQYIIGRRTRDAFAYIRRKLKIKATVAELEAIHRPAVLKLCAQNQTLLPGAVKLLKRLKLAKLRLVLVSSGNDYYVRTVLEKWLIMDYFDDIISGDEVVKGKPNPEPYQRAIKYLRLKPDECVVVEDAWAGIESAKSAGCFCVAVRNPNTPSPDCSRADRVVDSLDSITLEFLIRLGKKLN
jgi:HAD superfamily hydrolase (TIGR01509 family)